MTTIHPAALIFPPMSDTDFAALKADIAANGVYEPVWTWRGQLIDGRHRERACEELGIACPAREWHGDEDGVLAFVISMNLKRRQLTASQLACVSLAIEKYEAVRARKRQGARNDLNIPERIPESGEAREKAAAAVGVNPRYVSDAKAIETQAPDLLKEVIAGKKTIPQAVREIKERRDRENLTRPTRASLKGLYHGDFRDWAADIEDGSIELVFTDPPYDRDSLPLYDAAAATAARILKPGGSMICYVGQILLPDALSVMSKHLRYWWTAACVHEGGNQMMNKYGVRCGWKPLMWFVNGTRGDVANVVVDTVSGSREKHAHEWQQAEAEASYFIDKLCSPEGIVVDFFAGGGTTCAAAQKLGRKWIAFERDARHHESATNRLAPLVDAA